jgi:hypothetical protein
MALVNEQAATNGDASAGFLNPAIYALGQEPSYVDCFNDITTGNDFWPGSPTNYAAVEGYDLATGWGTPAGTNLINTLAPDLQVSPGGGLTFYGGPSTGFSAASQSYLLTNSGTNTVTWSLGSNAPWLNFSPTGGVLSPGGPAVTVTASVNATASNEMIGAYAGSVWFTNLTENVAQARPLMLTLTPQLIQNGGFETGDFSDWMESGNFEFTQIVSGQPEYVHSGQYGALLGPDGSEGYLSQTVPTTPGLLYQISLWLDSPDGEGPNEFSVAWAGDSLFDETNIGAIGWTNLQFMAPATAASSTLQIGFRDDPSYLALDDISVLPATPRLQYVASEPGAISFGWAALPNAQYEVEWTTNLAGGVWTSNGPPVATTNLLMTVTNAAGPVPTFYRVVLLQ